MVSYQDFRTGLTFAAVREMMFSPSEDRRDWRHRGRKGVLGYWRQLKQEMYDAYVASVKATEAAASAAASALAEFFATGPSKGAGAMVRAFIRGFRMAGKTATTDCVTTDDERGSHMASGYVSCGCRDCFDIAIADRDDKAPALCHDCEKAGCSGEGECKRDDAYGVECGSEGESEITS